ncbi:MAG: AAA family ATPase [Candidatus Thorarchaeota archaeon]
MQVSQRLVNYNDVGLVARCFDIAIKRGKSVVDEWIFLLAFLHEHKVVIEGSCGMSVYRGVEQDVRGKCGIVPGKNVNPVVFDDVRIKKSVAFLFKKSIDDSQPSSRVIIEWYFNNSKGFAAIARKHSLKKYCLRSLISSSDETKKKKSSQATSEDVGKFCVDLTEMAIQNKLGKIIGREDEIGRVITTLLRKIKSNPLLVGDAGVGKTAVVEGLAMRVASGDVPEKLKNVRILSVSMSSVVGGTQLRGQFEQRMQKIMEDVEAQSDAILFIDEMHTIVGAGNYGGSLDASNIMKPYLSRSGLRCIGATTYEDYIKHIRNDNALDRRFQLVTIDEPDNDETVRIMNGIQEDFSDYHGCLIREGAIDEMVRLAKRYLPSRFFPDKAIDVMDESCARAVIEGIEVDSDLIREVVADLASLPVDFMKNKDSERLEAFAKRAKRRIIGNDKAIDEFCRLVKNKMVLREGNSNGEACRVLIAGPTGIGRETLVRDLARDLYGDDSVILVDGLDYTERHSVSRILGSPPGYVGYREEPMLLRSIRRKPYSLILIKNIDRMDGSVLSKFTEIMQNSKIIDSTGRSADFSNAIIVVMLDQEKTTGIGFQTGSSNVVEQDLKWSMLGTMDGVIRFYAFDKSQIGAVIDSILEDIVDRMKSKIQISVSIPAKKSMCEECKDMSPSEVRNHVESIMEDAVVEGILQEKSEMRICQSKSQLSFQYR